ncbi:carboxy-terminal protease [Salmonella enterica subsp. enterica serovar Bareilly str. 2780]|nr:carboxy-terminal protease [Salmonella enterica subsp. enterica serovar Bareilly str. 2780]
MVALIKGPKGSKVRLEILPAGKGTKNAYYHADA